MYCRRLKSQYFGIPKSGASPRFRILRGCSYATVPPPFPCGHTLNFGKSEVFTPKTSPKSTDVRICLLFCPKNIRTVQTPSPLTANVFYGRPLSYDVILTLIFVSLVQHSLSFGPRSATVSNRETGIRN